jgi:multiple sugar transport system substrate-binding protein
MLDLVKKNYIYYYFVAVVTVLMIIIIVFNFFTLGLQNGNTKEEVIITYADNISPAHLKIINEFNFINKGKIRVEPIDLPFSKFSTNERKELLTRSLRSKSKKLDLFAIDLIWSARFAKWSEPLDKYVEEEDTTYLVKQALQSCFYDKQLVALPIYLDIGVMYYRKDLLKKLPNYHQIESELKTGITWEKFIQIRNLFNLDKNQFYIFPANNYEGLMCSYFEMLNNLSPNEFKKKDFKVNSVVNKKIFQFLFDLVYINKLSPVEITDFDENDCYEYFVNNNGIFLRGWPSSEKDYKNLVHKENIDSLIGITAVPHFNGSEESSVLGGWNIMISKYSDHKEEAFKFIKFLTNEKSQREMYETGTLLPVVQSIYDDEEFLKKYPSLKFDKLLLTRGIHRPFLENYTKISDIISYYINKVLKDKIPVNEALQKADETIKTGRILIR